MSMLIIGIIHFVLSSCCILHETEPEAWIIKKNIVLYKFLFQMFFFFDSNHFILNYLIITKDTHCRYAQVN